MANAKRFLACLSKCYYLLSALSSLLPLSLSLSLRSGLAPLMASFRARRHLSGIFGTCCEYFSSQLAARIVINGTRVWGTNVIKTTQSKAHRTQLYMALVVKSLRFILIEGINFYEGSYGPKFYCGQFQCRESDPGFPFSSIKLFSQASIVLLLQYLKYRLKVSLSL